MGVKFVFHITDSSLLVLALDNTERLLFGT